MDNNTTETIKKRYFDFMNNVNNRLLKGGGDDDAPVAEEDRAQSAEQPFAGEQQDILPLKEMVGDITKKDMNCDGKSNIVATYDQLDPKYLFTDDKAKGVSINPVQTAPSIRSKAELDQLLYSFYPIMEHDKVFPMSPGGTVQALITDIRNIITEGENLMRWIKLQFNQSNNRIVRGLELYIHNGYVHITRNDIKPYDTIKKQNIHSLVELKFQYGRKIDYEQIRDIMSAGNFDRNSSMYAEIKKVLKQEYIIALQPEPVYLTWCLKRLIMAWFADDVLRDNIRTIKVLVNQYRARNDQTPENVVMPSIVINTRYTARRAKLVITRLSYLYSTYTNIGWQCSNPTYFVKVNDLIYYSNGLLDLKLYFKIESAKGHPFNRTHTAIENATELVHQT